MIVYGDKEESADPREFWLRITGEIERFSRLSPGIERHSRLIGTLIDVGQLLQGVADDDFACAGVDRPTPATDALGDFLLTLAHAACRSWDSDFCDLRRIPIPTLPAPVPSHVRLRLPEGFAFYGVYPEAYIEAARRLTLHARPRVIGIRSIGTTLAAVVAAALGAEPPATVRPFGDPFARQVSIGPELERTLLGTDAHFIIVDEGPGQSGSSFAAVADWLQAYRVPLERIAFIPSHDGPPGPRSSEAHRRRWGMAQRVPADFGAALPQLLSDWLPALLGRVQSIEDVSAGKWRRHVYLHDEDWPAVVPAWERRKFLAEVDGQRVLAKFAGLSRIGESKIAMAEQLYASTFTPEPLALVHGFLVERWCDARPIAHHDRPMNDVGRYIGVRARLFPAAPASGASLSALLNMYRNNVGAVAGAKAAGALDGWRERLPTLERRVARVKTDNRLQRHEWLRGDGGRLLKADALDHHSGHELIGCQDPAWDIAGAIIEFGMSEGEQQQLVAVAELAWGRRIDCDLLRFYRLAYLGYAIGRASLGRDAAPIDGTERHRLDLLCDSYAAALQELLLESTRAGMWLESALG